MRPIAVLVAAAGAICALPPTAAAQTGECRPIADPAVRLACYDKAAAATPSPPAATSAAAGPAIAARPPRAAVDNGKYVDSIADEDAVVNARLKGICRGC
jgi:hypothetical protein